LTTADLATQALGPTHTTPGDGIGGMVALDKGSVDLVLCDLPSGETKAPFDNDWGILPDNHRLRDDQSGVHPPAPWTNGRCDL